MKAQSPRSVRPACQSQSNIVQFSPASTRKFFPEDHRATVLPITPTTRKKSILKQRIRQYRAEQSPFVAAAFGEKLANDLALCQILCPELFRRSRKTR